MQHLRHSVYFKLLKPVPRRLNRGKITVPPGMREKGEIMKLEFSKSGFPCLWEHGGGYSKTGEAVVIAGADGAAKRPIYIRQRGELANANHALIPVGVGDYIIAADRHWQDYEITVDRIVSIDGDHAETECVACHSEGQWGTPLPEHLISAVDAVKAKAACYHCRTPHYVAGDE